MKSGLRNVLLFVALLAASAPYAFGDISVSAATPLAQGYRYDVAFDRIHHVYLLVWDQPAVSGQLADTNGVPFGPRFTIANEGSLYTSWSSVSFGGPDADPTFCVTYLSIDATNVVRKYVRLVRVLSNGTVSVGPRSLVTQVFGGDYIAADQSRSLWDGSQFIVSSKVTPPGSPVPIPQVNHVDLAGNVSAPVQLGDGADYEAGPSIACAPDQTCLAIGFALGVPFGSRGGIWARRFSASSLQPIGGVFYIDDHSSRMDTPKLAYNSRTGKFGAVWFRQGPDNGGYADFRLIGEDGSMSPLDLSRSFGKGAGDFGWAFNPSTGTTAFVTKFTPAADLYAMEVGDDGYPSTAPMRVAQYVCCWPTYSTEMTAGEGGRWLSAFMMTKSGVSLSLQGAGGGGGTPTPPTPSSRPQLAVDFPSNNANVPPSGFLVAGWAADAGSSSGPGMDVIAVWAFPTNGSAAILAGIANYGSPRPDVGAYLGSAQFTNTGYGLIASLPAGTYTLAICAHSTVSNAWATPVNVRVNVIAPTSRPAMWVDTPTAGSAVSSLNVQVGGWALDLGAASGPGVDAVHVWAYPQGAATPVFVGAAATGGFRPDVGGVFGSQFSTSGFNLSGTLAPGNYTLVVFEHSTVTNSFNNAVSVPITVR